jgi:hypothetical protein
MKEMRKTYHAPKTRLVVPPGMYLMDGEQLIGDQTTVVTGSGDKTFTGDVPVGPGPITDPDDIGAKGYGGGFNRYFE